MQGRQEEPREPHPAPCAGTVVIRDGHVVSVPRGSSWLALLHIIPLLLGSPSPFGTPVGFAVPCLLWAAMAGSTFLT